MVLLGLLGTALLLHALLADNTWKVRQKVTDEDGLVEGGRLLFSKEEWKWNLHA